MWIGPNETPKQPSMDHPRNGTGEHLVGLDSETLVGRNLKFRDGSRICPHNLVDPASSHMLVSKIKPCMSQYKLLHGETANGSLKQLSFIWWSFITWITMVILELIHAPRPNFLDGLCLLGTEPTQALPGLLVIHDNRTNRMASAGDESFKFLTYQLPTVGYWPTVAMTGNGELGFDSGEGA